MIFINTGVVARRYGAAKVLKDTSACAAPKRLALGGTVEIGRQVTGWSPVIPRRQASAM